MSSFVIGNNTINNILNFLLTTNNQEKYDLLVNVVGSDDPTMIGQAIQDMNILATSQRYRTATKQTISERGIKKYEFIQTYYPHPTQIYKSIGCLLYQCYEGTVPGSKLYKAMKKIKSMIAEEIVKSTELYEKARWG